MPPRQPPEFAIDVFHDTVCPWSRIGNANLMAALAEWDGSRPVVRYRPFFLDPGAPPEGRDFAAYVAARYGGAADVARSFDGPRRAGSVLGLRFDFERITRSPSTLSSHALVALAPVGEVQSRLLDAVYAAYFEDARDIGERETLVQLALANGLDESTTRRGLDDGALLASVREAADDARRGGITSVPLFVIDERAALSGAHPPGALLDAIRVAARARAR